MMHRMFAHRFMLDDFAEKLVDNGHYGEFVVKYDDVMDVWHLYW